MIPPRGREAVLQPRPNDPGPSQAQDGQTFHSEAPHHEVLAHTAYFHSRKITLRNRSIILMTDRVEMDVTPPPSPAPCRKIRSMAISPPTEI